MARRGIPGWLELDKDNFKGVLKALPTREDITMPVQEQLVVNYLFDGEGRPTWTLGGTPGFTGGTAPHRAFFVHCPGCPAIVDAPTAAAGTSTTVFSSRTTGTYSTNITLPAPLSGTWVRNNLPIQMLSPPQPAAAAEQP